MREIDKLAKEKFNGDYRAAIEYMYRNYASKKNPIMDKFYSELNKEELKIAAEILVQMTKEKKGENVISEMINASRNLDSLNLSSEEVLNAEKNPYKAKVGKDFLKLLIVNGGLLALYAVLKQFNINAQGMNIEAIATTIASIYTTSIALDAGPNLMNYFKFKFTKKQLENLQPSGECDF